MSEHVQMVKRFRNKQTNRLLYLLLSVFFFCLQNRNMKLSIFLLVVLSVTVLCVDYEHVKKVKNQRIIEPDTKMSFVSSSRSAQESDDERVDNFKNQHIIETEESCDKLIRKRKIKDVNGKDKERNTFIFSTFDKVKAICTGKQRVYKNDNLYRSSEEMELLYCKLQHDKNNYKGEMIKKHIEIACVKIDGVLQPVHFECCC